MAPALFSPHLSLCPQVLGGCLQVVSPIRATGERAKQPFFKKGINNSLHGQLASCIQGKQFVPGC